MLTPPGGNLGSTLDVLVGAALVFSVPDFAAFVVPDFVFAAPLEEGPAVPLASAVSVAVLAALPVLVGGVLPVSAGELSESIPSITHQSDAPGITMGYSHLYLILVFDVSKPPYSVLMVAMAKLRQRM